MARRKNPNPIELIYKAISAIAGAALKSAMSSQSRRATATARQMPKPTSSQRPINDLPHTWPALGDFEFEVVGESHYQRAIESLVRMHGTWTEFEVQIVPEIDNPHDHMAVAIKRDGQLLAYMARRDARSYRRRLASLRLGRGPATCGARIIGGHQTAAGPAMFGLQLDIKPFD